VHGRPHRGHAFRDQRGLAHEAGAESAARHALARTTAVEVDLVVTGLLAGARGRRQLARRAAAELQRNRMLLRIEREQPRTVPALDRRRRDHLGVEQQVRREAAQEVAAVPVGPVHHRGHGNSSIQLLICYRVFLHGVRYIEIGRTDMGDDA
jgi:hypothetical protein